MIIKNSYFYFIIPLLMLLASCSEGEKPPESEQKLLFDVNAELLSDSIYLNNYDLKFNPPLGWGTISKDLFDSLRQRISDQQISDTIKTIPLHVFVSGSQSILNVSAVEASSGSLKEIIDLFEERELNKAGKVNFKRADFLKDNLPVTQFLIEENNIIIFKVLVKINTTKLVEFDYIIPKNIYSSEVKSIESSIGSIKLTNQSIK